MSIADKSIDQKVQNGNDDSDHNVSDAIVQTVLEEALQLIEPMIDSNRIDDMIRESSMQYLPAPSEAEYMQAIRDSMQAIRDSMDNDLNRMIEDYMQAIRDSVDNDLNRMREDYMKNLTETLNRESEEMAEVQKHIMKSITVQYTAIPNEQYYDIEQILKGIGELEEGNDY